MKRYHAHLRNAFVALVVAFATCLALGYQRAAPTAKPTVLLHDDTELSEQPGQTTIVRVYDVQSLLHTVARPSLPTDFYSNANQSQGQGLFQNQQTAQYFSPDDLAIDELKKFITDNVDTISWKDNGGDIGSISKAGAIFVIEQTPRAHQKIERLLHLLNGEP